MQLSMTEVLDDTIQFYKGNPRASSKNGCRYSMETEKGETIHCALGRFLIDPEDVERKLKGDVCGALDLATRMKQPDLDALLKPEVRGFPLQFWDHLQCFHDTDEYWTEPAHGGIYLSILSTGGHNYQMLLRAWIKLVESNGQ